MLYVKVMKGRKVYEFWGIRSWYYENKSLWLHVASVPDKGIEPEARVVTRGKVVASFIHDGDLDYSHTDESARKITW